jgi:dTMP kinase
MANKKEFGKFVAIYGINGIGKTTQVEMLVEYLKKKGKNAVRLKYPVYDLEPEGPFIYKYLREPKFRAENELSTHKLQKKYAENRMRYEPMLRERLKRGEWIIAEDYTGTGISWGLTWGGDLAYLEDINEDLLKPDLEILMHGNRFISAIEKDHRNEMDGERIMICKNFHNLLASRYGWERINPKQKMEKVHEDILKIVKKNFKLK